MLLLRGEPHAELECTLLAGNEPLFLHMCDSGTLNNTHSPPSMPLPPPLARVGLPSMSAADCVEARTGQAGGLRSVCVLPTILGLRSGLDISNGVKWL